MTQKIINPLHFALYSLVFTLCVFILFGCQAIVSYLKPPLEEEGEVFLYLEPFPQEAEKLRFKIEAIYALSIDGNEIPLSTSLNELDLRSLKRQRLLASGRILPNSYIGFLFKVGKAILKLEDGEKELILPEKPTRIEFPFRILRKKAYVFSLDFRYRESIKEDFNFSPYFSIFIPARPILSLTGYVSNSGSNNITVFDKKLVKVVSVIATGRGPSGMVLNPRTGRVYVALSGDDTIGVIDLSAGEVIEHLRLRTGDQPQELTISPDGRVLLVVNKGSNTVSFIDPNSMFELGRIEVGRGPNSILMDQTGRRAFIFNRYSGTISVVDVANRAIVSTISTDPGPLRGQFNRKGDKLYVIHEFSPYLTVYDPSSLTLLGRYAVRFGMSSIKVDPRTDLIYLGRERDFLIEVYEPNSFVSIDSINRMGGINYMTIDGDENNLYMINSERKSLMVSSLVRKRIINEMDVGESPYFVVMMGER